MPHNEYVSRVIRNIVSCVVCGRYFMHIENERLSTKKQIIISLLQILLASSSLLDCLLITTRKKTRSTQQDIIINKSERACVCVCSSFKFEPRNENYTL